MHESDFIRIMHHCSLNDDIRMEKTFTKIKTKLADQETHHVSGFCVGQSNQFIFKKGLESLEKLVMFQFIVCCKNTIETNFIQASLETIHSINLRSQINFIVSGNKDFSSSIEILLHFLGVKQIQIQ